MARRGRGEGGPATGEDAVVLLACVTAEVPHVFGDDIMTSCSICGTAIYHRPHALVDLPKGAKAACLPCTAQVGRSQGITFGITRRTVDEVAAHLSKRR